MGGVLLLPSHTLCSQADRRSAAEQQERGVFHLDHRNRLELLVGADEGDEADQAVLVGIEDQLDVALELAADEDLSFATDGDAGTLHVGQVRERRALDDLAVLDDDEADQVAVGIETRIASRNAERRLLDDARSAIGIVDGRNLEELVASTIVGIADDGVGAIFPLDDFEFPASAQLGDHVKITPFASQARSWLPHNLPFLAP